jgi:hypothetical protein
MARSAATSVEQYLRELPEERRAALQVVRRVILRYLPKGYRESMNWGMISYEIPLSRYPETYNKQPLACAALAAQKNYNALYLMGVYADPARARRLREAFREAGKKLDMGKSCIRFRAADELALDAIGEVIASTPVDEFIRAYEASRRK